MFNKEHKLQNDINNLLLSNRAVEVLCKLDAKEL